jgi:hypothetical protein
MAQKAHVKKERSVYAYRELWHASQCTLESGQKNPEGSVWQFLASAMLTAFTFEAYLNHVGQRTIDCWKYIDRKSTYDKFKLICKRLEVSFPEKSDEHQALETVKKLIKFRNTIAHGRSTENDEPLKIEEIIPVDDVDIYLGKQLLTEWEGLIRTDDFAQLARTALLVVLNKLHDGFNRSRTDGKKEDLLDFGRSFGRATLIKNV